MHLHFKVSVFLFCQEPESTEDDPTFEIVPGWEAPFEVLTDAKPNNYTENNQVEPLEDQNGVVENELLTCNDEEDAVNQFALNKLEKNVFLPREGSIPTIVVSGGEKSF